MSKNKTKVKVITPGLGSFAEMEAVMGKLATATIARDDIMLKLDKRITRLRELHGRIYGQQLAGCNANIALWEKQIRLWAEAHEQEYFKDKRSLETRFGVMKFFKGQWGTELKSGWSWKKVVDRIKECGLDALFIRSVEVPDKELLIKSRDHVLTSKAGQFTVGDLGVKVLQAETFTIEINREPVPAAAPQEVTA